MTRKRGADAVRTSIAALTPGEQKVWDMYVQGMDRREIAAAMGLKVVTIGIRLSLIKDKLALR